MTEIILLLVSLGMILASAEFFTNGVESLGRRLALSQAVVGSLLAAVGTALPETILPFVAILLHGGATSAHIGVGAILGAPFMLSTLVFFLVGTTALLCYFGKRRACELRIELGTMQRDLVFFLTMYGAAVVLPLFMTQGRVLIAIGLVFGYFLYAYKTLRGESDGLVHADTLYFSRLAGGGQPGTAVAGHPAGLPLIIIQVLCALSLMVAGAHIFVKQLESLSASLGMNPLLFALLVAPIATELPEKFNSISWTIKGRDPLALGNITGAMVFQSTFPVSLGLLFTDWSLSGLPLLSAVLALVSAALILLDITLRKRLSVFTALMAGSFYLLYVVVIMLQTG